MNSMMYVLSEMYQHNIAYMYLLLTGTYLRLFILQLQLPYNRENNSDVVLNSQINFLKLYSSFTK